MSALQDALRELAEARRQHEIAKGYAEEYSDRLLATTLYQESVAAEKRAHDLWGAARDAMSKVRELALDNFYATENSRPAEGVQVKLFSKVEYAPNLALDWCIAHATKYLQLDTRAFEKAAPVLKDLGAPVTLTREPRVSIGTDLSAWLTSEGERDGN